MATSGSYNFSTTRDLIITDAMLYIGAIGEGETPGSTALTEAARMLNMLMKAWASDGMPLWSLKRGYILPFSGSSSIATDSHVVVDYSTTTMLADAAISDTVLSVTDTSEMSASDEVGIELSDGTMFWTTIVTVDAADQITVLLPLSGAATAGDKVYSYTASSDRIQKPLRVLDSQMADIDAESSYPITQISRSEYFNLGDRASEGAPNQFFYDPDRASGTFYIFPRFQDGGKVLEFTYHRPFQDFDAAGDEPDCPQEFHLALVVGLAAVLAPKYGVDSAARKLLIAEAKQYREEALTTVYSEGSLYLQPMDMEKDNG